MADQRFPGPRHHTSMNGRVSWNCVPLHSRAASPAALDVEAISETMWLNRHLLDAGTTGASRSAYRKVAKQIAARLTEQEERG